MEEFRVISVNPLKQQVHITYGPILLKCRVRVRTAGKVFVNLPNMVFISGEDFQRFIEIGQDAWNKQGETNNENNSR